MNRTNRASWRFPFSSVRYLLLSSTLPVHSAEPSAEVLHSRVGSITEKQARRQLEAILSRVNDPGYVPESNTTFQALAQEWSDQAFPEMKPSTALNMRGHLTNHLLPFFGEGRSGRSPRGILTRSCPGWLSVAKRRRTSSAR
jgi:hypothetical protein